MSTAQPMLTQEGREHYTWKHQPADPQFAGEVFLAEHPTCWEYAIMRCPSGRDSKRVQIEIVTLEGSVHAMFGGVREARDAVEARWLTYPGYGRPITEGE